MQTNTNEATRSFAVGNRIEAGKPGTEDYDTGAVLSISEGSAYIAWDSGVRTACPLSELRLQETT